MDTAGKIMIPISLVNNICRRQNLGAAMKTLYRLHNKSYRSRSLGNDE
ncbi:MAG: hypothetical protein WAT88_08295 [Saprospiraceae bacterium]